MKGIEPKPTTPIGLNALLYQSNAELRRLKPASNANVMHTAKPAT